MGKNKELNIFLLKIFVFYLFWLLSENYLYYESPFYSRFWSFLYHILLVVVRSGSALVLEWLGYEIVTGYNVMAIVGSYGVVIGNNCLGLGLSLSFIALIVSYPGPWKKKLWYIPLGLLVILAANIARVVSIILTLYRHNKITGMEQHDLFNNIIYIMIFLMWLLWVQVILPAGKKNEPLPA